MPDKANLKGMAWVELPGYVKAITDKAVKYSIPDGHFYRQVWIPRAVTQGEPQAHHRLLVREWFIIKNELMPLEGVGKNLRIKGVCYAAQ